MSLFGHSSDTQLGKPALVIFLCFVVYNHLIRYLAVVKGLAFLEGFNFLRVGMGGLLMKVPGVCPGNTVAGCTEVFSGIALVLGLNA